MKKPFGFYAALVTTALTVVTFGIAILTPPYGGPYCVESHCYQYPYTDIASRFPRDYYWMYAAMFLYVGFTALMAAIRRQAHEGKKIFGDVGFIFAAMSSLVFLLDYFTQLAIIQPSLVLGEFDGIALWSQFNPHGIFIALEELGFFLMSLSMIFMSAVFQGSTRSEKIVKWTFIGSFVLTILAFAYYSLMFGIMREYRFEVAVISVNWIALLVAGPALMFYFSRIRQMP
jgi:hypothetical protein